MIPHLIGFIKSNAYDGLGNSLIPSWATLRQAPFNKLRTQLRQAQDALRTGWLSKEKRAETAEYSEPDVVIPSSRWLWLAQAKLCLKRRQGERANAG
jgi:hypothetical protein